MKKLTLTGKLQRKFSRLDTEVKNLYYSGLEPQNLASQVCVAVVGTRKPTPYGKDVTEKIVHDLAEQGVVIVSGFAFGIDVTAHRACIEARGSTIAVLASDVNHIYPASNRGYADALLGAGCFVSEHASNPRPRAHDFLDRNRIIAALSDAILIPEAAERSGSLNTARHARELDIPVFAVPGRISDPMSAGTNRLIATGEASSITHSRDILSALHISARKPSNKLLSKAPEEVAVYSAIRSGLADATLLQKELKLDTSTLQIALTTLELDGMISQDELGHWHHM